MSRRTTGWLFVAVQAALLVALIRLPHRGDWPTPTVVRGFGVAVIVVGLLIIAVAAAGLGRSLTPNPVPVADGRLVTSGLYGAVRHPIYSGVLIIAVGLIIRSGSLIGVAIGVATFFFFNAKARWEEARLSEAYPDYATYAAVTARFVPRPDRLADLARMDQDPPADR